MVKIFSYFSKLYSTRILDNVQASLLHHRAEYSSQFPSVLLFYFYILILYLDRFSLWYNESNPNLAFTFTVYGSLCGGKGVRYNLSTCEVEAVLEFKVILGHTASSKVACSM